MSLFRAFVEPRKSSLSGEMQIIIIIIVVVIGVVVHEIMTERDFDLIEPTASCISFTPFVYN